MNFICQQIGDIAPSTEWQLLKIVKSRNIKYYDCCTEPYVDITYNMTLARRSPSYKALVITPITGKLTHENRKNSLLLTKNPNMLTITLSMQEKYEIYCDVIHENVATTRIYG